MFMLWCGGELKHTQTSQEKEDRYTKIKAEVYENSMQLLHGFQRGHNDAQDTTMRRIEFLEKELDQGIAT